MQHNSVHKFVRLFFTLAFAVASLLPVSLSATPLYEPHTGQAIIHYHRPTDDYAGWGLHVWGDITDQVTWDKPLEAAGESDFGVYFTVNLKADGKELGFVIHNGEEKDPGPDMRLDISANSEAWIVSGSPEVFTAQVDPAEVPTGLPASEEPTAPEQADEPHESAIESVSFPGNYVALIGGSDWEPADPTIQASDEDGDGIWTLTVILPEGSYEFKAAINSTWEINFGAGGEMNGANLAFAVVGTQEVAFSFDAATNAVNLSMSEPAPIEEPPPAPDDNYVVMGGLGHDSRSGLFRTPSGAVSTGSDVNLRLRTFANDVDSVILLLANLDSGTQTQVPMRIAAQDGDYLYWEATVNVGDKVTVWNYQFQVTNGTGMVSMADDPALDGGTGAFYPAALPAGSGWDIYVYHPEFSSPEWSHNAVIYQIFPDRFRNGEPANDPIEEDWFYPNEREHVFPVTPWNQPVPDPMPLDPNTNPDWYGTFSSTFYGGDLQGVMEKLDYLQELGVNTIYFNPIFDSPSNHKYDGRDYRQVDDNLAIVGDFAASNEYFVELAAEVQKRGMHLILDGVPNHVSSDAPIFDRFGRWEADGACESESSPYRDWFFFDPARPAGSGQCAGDTNYRAWASFDTLPQLNNTNEAVIDNWLGEDGIIQQWLSTPGVDGFRIDVVPDVVGVNPTYFELMRNEAKAANPDALLISETWAERDARLRVLGDEFDSSMNYRFRRAVLGFLRDTDFDDNDGRIEALSASEFEAALRAIEEDYPPAAFMSAMNLIDSHDVNRAVHVLDHDGIDYTQTAPQPVNDFEDGRKRLALAALLQFTLPGAPTVYYGDEVGLTGFGGDIPRDDPYNRQPYPWADADGYDDLPDWRKADADLLAHYQMLGKLRAEYSFLRTGSWDTLTLDDASGLYVFGRKDETGAAIVAINRGEEVATASLDLTNYLPHEALLVDPTDNEDAQTIDKDGVVEYDVQPMSFHIWVTDEGTDMSTPGLASFYGSEGDASVTLTLEGGGETAIAYNVYRSLVSGGHEVIGSIEKAGDTTEFVDEGLVNGLSYHYYVTAVAANGLEGEASEPLIYVPHIEVSEVLLQDPLAIQHTLSAINPTVDILGAVFVPGVTEGDEAGEGVKVQIGYAPSGSKEYIWVDEVRYESETQGGADIYVANLLPEAAGEYDFRWRASTTNGRDWSTSEDAGTLTVLPSEDTEAPKPPFRIDELFASGNQLAFAWRVSRPGDLYNFRVCRRDVTTESTEEEGEEGECPVRFDIEKETTVLSDTTVLEDHTYVYTVQTVDTSFNVSPPSKPLTMTAALSFVDVTWRVLVPAPTPKDDLVFIAGDNGEVFGSAFNPGLADMTPAGENLWEWTATVKEGSVLNYKYTRGSWETVEQWGTIAGFTNRLVEVVNTGDGTMLIEDTATDWGAGGPDDRRGVQAWRDPLVVTATTNADAVTVEFSVDVKAAGEVIVVVDGSGNGVAGRVESEGLRTFVFTPDSPLEAGEYTATAFNVESDVKMAVPHEWLFVVE